MRETARLYSVEDILWMRKSIYSLNAPKTDPSIIELQLQTYMMNGTRPEELAKAVEAERKRQQDW